MGGFSTARARRAGVGRARDAVGLLDRSADVDAWVTQIFSLVYKKVLFGLLTFTAMDFNRPLVTFKRKNKEEATHLHAQLRGIVTQEMEEDWCALLPAYTPPEGCSKAVQPPRDDIPR